MSDDVTAISEQGDFCVGVPVDRQDRLRLRECLRNYIADNQLIAPVSLSDLKKHASQVLKQSDLGEDYQPYAVVLLNNELWRDGLMKIPFDKRLLLLPQCLKHSQSCPAEIDHLGLICKHCGRCVIDRMTRRAEELGYAVLIAEGSPVVMAMIESGQVQATLGVSCLSVLERVFPYMEAAAVPGVAIPLLKDGCVDTFFDEDWLMELLEAYQPDGAVADLTRLKQTVADWFESEALGEYFESTGGHAGQVAADWLAQAGKRYRPMLAAGVYASLTGTAVDELPEKVKKAAVAVECFHKASLVHDDIEDADDQRYDKPTLHVKEGIPIALNAGDYLIGQGYRLLAELDCENAQKVEILKVAADGHRLLCVGQGEELATMASAQPISAEKVLEIFSQKTSPAFAVALKIGAILAGADASMLKALDTYSEAIGIAYQIRDDLHDWQDAQTKQLSIISSLMQGRTAEEAFAQARRLLKVNRQATLLSLDAVAQSGCKAFLRRVITKLFDGTERMGCCDEYSPESD
ncbi:MAG: polyprenyl synthetase family protein [Planctomycetota bacterium]|jgi:geranylgeranyl pyrophosphate synthase